jgi:hypothetical protein
LQWIEKLTNIRIRTGLCIDYGCTGEDYRLCDYCGEHDCHLLDQPHYYNYGFSKRMIKMCSDCIINQDIKLVLKTNQMFEGALSAIYKSIREIQESKPKRIKSLDVSGVNYYEAVKHAHDQSSELRDYLGKDIKKRDINKNLKGLWEITYWILNEEQKIRVVSRNPDNFLVSTFDLKASI